MKLIFLEMYSNKMADDNLKNWCTSHNQAHRRILAALLETDFRRLLARGEFPDKDTQTLYDRLDSESKRCRWHEGGWWITINFDQNSVSVDDILYKMERISQWKWIKYIAYSLEQRGETPEEAGKGPHVHMWIETKTPREFRDVRSDLVKALLHGKKRYIGHAGKALLNIVASPISHKTDKMLYLSGEKWDDDKKGKVLTDTYWRGTLGLSQIYESGQVEETFIPRICIPDAENQEDQGEAQDRSGQEAD